MAQIKLTGWKAVILILVVVGFGAFRLISARSTLDTEATAELALWLRGEYSSRYLQNIDAETITPEQVQQLLDLENLEFKSVSATGMPDDMVVRVEIAINGQPPPDGRSVRYWRMEHSTITGWRMVREANVILYYLNII